MYPPFRSGRDAERGSPGSTWGCHSYGSLPTDPQETTLNQQQKSSVNNNSDSNNNDNDNKIEDIDNDNNIQNQSFNNINNNINNYLINNNHNYIGRRGVAWILRSLSFLIHSHKKLLFNCKVSPK